jgi:hypothetical protein
MNVRQYRAVLSEQKDLQAFIGDFGRMDSLTFSRKKIKGRAISRPPALGLISASLFITHNDAKQETIIMTNCRPWHRGRPVVTVGTGGAKMGRPSVNVTAAPLGGGSDDNSSTIIRTHY